MAKGFDISQFRTSFSKSGEPANPTNYKAFFGRWPNLFGSMYMETQNIIEYRCESISVPESSLKTIERKTYGIPEKVVFSKENQMCNVSLIVSDNNQERDLFYIWLESILESNDRKNVRYFSEYVGDFVVQQYNKSGVESYTIVLKDAYPISIQEMPLSWNSNNDYVRLNIALQYTTIEEYTGKYSPSNSGIVTAGEIQNLPSSQGGAL